MVNSFIFNGINSDDYDLIVNKLPDLQSPEQKGSFIEVPGRDGLLFQDDNALEATEKMIILTLKDTMSVSQIKAWLRGAGELVLSSEPDVIYKARVVGTIDIQRYGPRWMAAVRFSCSPHGYLPAGKDMLTLTAASTIYNLGTAPSKPVVTVYGTGDITLTINSKNVHLDAVSAYVTINAEIEDCYKDTTPKNNDMVGEWPVLLDVGPNDISWTGTVTKIEIIPNWRNL